ncbi:hypothetical protein EFO70_13540 [Lacticaseibacillus rhamnosus]|nr:hypothetical protein [Lacticaseibacillus rhamnosus]MCT3182473.1 hypothetical protein [Lacticaseibacillus rhamnosus]
MARSWPLRLRSLHADFCAGERVMESEREPASVLSSRKTIQPLLVTIHFAYTKVKRFHDGGIKFGTICS